MRLRKPVNFENLPCVCKTDNKELNAEAEVRNLRIPSKDHNFLIMKLGLGKPEEKLVMFFGYSNVKDLMDALSAWDMDHEAGIQLAENGLYIPEKLFKES